jgi:octaprenyl-diphosphate synthase
VILTDLTKPIKKDLECVEKKISQSLKTENVFIQQMVDYLAHSTGKRVRPALAILSAKYCGNLSEQTISLGAALEMLHVATLIHDDIIDNSAVRRKQKTLNFKWGNEISVLMGDYVFASSFYLMAKDLPKNVVSSLADTTNIICRGEISETFNRFNVDLTEDQYLEVIKEKTAVLFAASCQTGAMLAGADALIVKSLHRFGLSIGMAFQVVDDTLDFVGKQTKVGKPVMSDLREGKLTLPVIYCLASATKAENKKLKAIILRKIKTASDLKFLEVLLRKYNAINRAIQKARYYADDAKMALKSLSGNGDKSEFVQFSDFLINRDF